MPSMTKEGIETGADIEETTRLSPRFGPDGTLPAVAVCASTGDVLMLAYMNEDALARTLETGEAHYWSRSRGKLWKKGETSGNIQEVQEVRVDCDADCVLLRVRQVGGAACHMGYRSCFYRRVQGDSLVIDGEKVFDPVEKYGDTK